LLLAQTEPQNVKHSEENQPTKTIETFDWSKVINKF